MASPKLANATGLLVGLIMGSDSDWPTTEPAAEVLAEFGTPFEVGAASAHRTPEHMIDYARSAVDKDLRCTIVGTGGAAHLPGMVALVIPLPVIGVPRALENLEGIDSLLSTVQMPGGVSAVVVGVGGAKNAGLPAVCILSAGHSEFIVAMENYQVNMCDKVLVKDERLHKKLVGEQGIKLAPELSTHMNRGVVERARIGGLPGFDPVVEASVVQQLAWLELAVELGVGLADLLACIA